MAAGPKGAKAVAKSKKAGELASSGKSRKAAEDAKSPFAGHEKLTPAEVESVAQYQGFIYGPINQLLRGQRASILSSFQEHIPRLDSAMSRTAFTKDTVLYRGTSPVPGVNFASLAPGHTISDLGFHSTSVKRSVAEKFVGSTAVPYGAEASALITIKARKGSKGLAVHQVATGTKYQSGPDAEHEVLLPRGSTFKVVRVSKRKDGNFHVTVQLQ